MTYAFHILSQFWIDMTYLIFPVPNHFLIFLYDYGAHASSWNRTDLSMCWFIYSQVSSVSNSKILWKLRLSELQ